jgi:hypothetical protein
MALPDFLGIGAQKAGTSWLNHQLRRHPAIWMPPVKELHYFDDPSVWPLVTRIFSDSQKGSRVRRHFSRQGRELVKLRLEHPLWWLRFFCRRRTDHWYASLFSPGPGQLAGEVTPSYARLEEPVVARIHALLPRARIIYLLRNPIHQIWSHAAMHFSKYGHQGVHTVHEEKITTFLETRNVAQHSDYLQNLQVWERFYPPPQIFIGFLDQLAHEPRALLRDVYHFLGVESSDRFIPESVHVKRNARRYPPMPDQIARTLALRCHEQIEQLHQRFANRYTADWLESANRMLK